MSRKTAPPGPITADDAKALLVAIDSPWRWPGKDRVVAKLRYIASGDDSAPPSTRRSYPDVFKHDDGTPHAVDGPLGCPGCANERRKAKRPTPAGGTP